MSRLTILRNRSVPVVFIALFLIPTTFLTATAQEAFIHHSTVTGAMVGEPVAVNATIEGSEEDALEGRLYYRHPGEDAFAYAEMTIDGFNITGIIPGVEVSGDYLEYYIEATLADGATLTYPDGAPAIASPLQVIIQPVSVGMAKGEPAVVILSPEPGAKITEDRLLIAVSFQQQIRPINVQQIRVLVDGYDLTKNAQVSEDMITLVVEGIKPGEHAVALYLEKEGKRERLTGWGFRSTSPEIAVRPPGVVTGNVNSGYSHEDISNRIRNHTYLDGNVNGTYKKVEWAAKAYVTSLERGYLQTQQRFLASVRYGALTVRAGDTQPRLSEFTLWGTRTRGAHIAVRSSQYDMDVVWGYTRRSIEGEFNDATIHVFNAYGDTLRSVVDPTQDSVRIERQIIQPGTYSRKLLAIRPGFHFTRNVVLGINVMKVKDDDSSIDYGLSPEDNLIIGADLNMSFDHRRIMFNTETAISMYNSNISAGPMKDAEKLKNLIVVNQFFEPLPSDAGILEEDISPVRLASKLFSELLESSLAHRTSLTLNYFKNELRLGYKSIGRSFNSLGSPTVQTDVAGFNIQDRFRLFRNRLFITLGLELYHDNVNERSETTTDRNIMRFNIAYYSPPGYPNASLGYRVHNRKNDGELVTYPNLVYPDSVELVDLVDHRLDNSSTTYNFALDQSFLFAGMDNNARFSFSKSATEDEIAVSNENSTDMTSYSIGLSSRKGERIESRVSLSMSTQEAYGGNFSTDYNAISAGGKYMLLSNLWLTGGLGLTLVEGGNDALNPQPTDQLENTTTPRSSVIDYNRMQISAGAEFRYKVNHKFALNAYKVFHGDEGSTTYWDNRLEKNKDAPGYIRQDDFVTRLRYSFNF